MAVQSCNVIALVKVQVLLKLKEVSGNNTYIYASATILRQQGMKSQKAQQLCR